MLYPISQPYLLMGQHAVRFQRAYYSLQRDIALIALAYSQHIALYGFVSAAKGYEHPLAEDNVILRPVGKEPVYAAVGYVHYHLCEQILPSFHNSSLFIKNYTTKALIPTYAKRRACPPL